MKSSVLLLLLYCSVFYSCNRFNKHPNSCMENPDKGKLLIFVGEKIEVTETGEEEIIGLPYLKFKARYKVLDVVCGDFDGNEITFIGYDHYGMPAFSNYKNCILYVYKEKDTFYHESYLFDPLYKTKTGEWASPCSPMNFALSDPAVQKMIPRPVDFAEEVSFDVKGGSRNWLKERYPTPYYEVRNKRAIAKYGNYVEEIVEFKKREVLNSRGYYGKTDTNKIKFQDVTLADIRQEEQLQILPADKNELVKTAYVFFDFIRRRDSAAIRQMSFDSVICSICEEPPHIDYENNLESFDSFYVSTKKYLTFSQLELEIKNKVFEVSVRKTEHEEESILKSNPISVVYSLDFMVIENIDGNRIAQKNKFEFIKVDGKYRFYGMKTDIASYKERMKLK